MESTLVGIAGIPLTIILRTITSTTRYNKKDKALPYARLLILLFEYYDVDLQGKIRETYTSSKDMKSYILSRIAYTRAEEAGNKNNRRKKRKFNIWSKKRVPLSSPMSPQCMICFIQYWTKFEVRGSC